MAVLKFISETGMFHSACSVSWGGGEKWYGFKPVAHRSPAGQGFVDESDRSSFINHYATFRIDDSLLHVAIDTTVAKYANATYVLGVCDCVSFTADVARAARLGVPAVNLTPYGFLKVLAFWNKPESEG